ncbi:MAG: PHP domain-containing protein [Promethearchaeota archaeon]
MKTRSFIRDNKFLTIISFIFFIWFVFLLVLSIFSERTVIFYDALGQVDISQDYSSKYPLLRYFIEPLYAIGYILEYKFTWMFLFLMFYPILRGIYLLLKKKGNFNSNKYKFISSYIVDVISFSFKILMVAILIVGIYLLIGYNLQGYFFLSRYFMVPIQLAVRISLAFIAIKIVYSIIQLFNPKLITNRSKKVLNRTVKKNLVKIRKINREIVLYVGIGTLLLASNILFISTPFPTHKIEPIIPLEEDEFLFDFHVHTIYSDGWLTVEERIKWYIKQGISGAAFTDHDNLRGAKSAQKYVEEHNLDFLVFIGVEWTDNANEIHMNYYGVTEEIVPLQSYTPGGPIAMNVSDTISYVKANGGYIFVNHYNYNLNPSGGYGIPYTLDQLRDWGIDGFEIVNGGSYGRYQQIRDYCISNNLTCIGGSDIHTNEDLNTFIRLKLADPSNFTIPNIFKTLKNNTHEIIAINLYPKVVEFPSKLNNLGFYVLERYINYLLNLDLFQVFSWMIWSGIIYLCFSTVYRKVKKIDLKYLKREIC